MTFLIPTAAFFLGALIGAVVMGFLCGSSIVNARSELADLEARIDNAIDQVTEGANATVRRMAKILKGEG